MLTRALLSVVAGTAAGLVAAAVCVGAYVLLLLLLLETSVLEDSVTAPEPARVAFATVFTLTPVVAALGALAGALAVLRRLSDRGINVSALIAGVLCGATILFLLHGITRVNACEFDVSWPLWWVETDPDC